VHLAAHAELNPTSPLFSRVFLAPDAQNDGSLTVQEVYGLNLARADLVVLSACDTQLGAQSRGDDLVGLNRVFIYAGAPSVIASLWRVNDEATAVLMTAFYRQLRAGASKAQALQAAQVETRRHYPHPYYWAAFVLTGDPGTSAGGSAVLAAHPGRERDR
jgi:CHAT domain-containing protein